MKTAILTDSNSGIFPKEGKRLGVHVLPMPVILDGREYFEGESLSNKKFYQMLKEGADASTSQPAPGTVTSAWDELLSGGYDEVLYIPMSAGLSSSCRTAQTLARDYAGRVWVADTRRVSITLWDCVMEAVKLVGAGRTAAQAKAELEAAAMDSIIFLGVDTLKYFKKNGRCTAATAALGTILSIKPLLRCAGENFDAIAKVRGMKNCQRKQLETAKAAAEALRRNGKPLYVGITSSFEGEADARDWLAQAREVFPGDMVHYEPLPFSVICHTGLNAFGMGISRAV